MGKISRKVKSATEMEAKSPEFLFVTLFLLNWMSFCNE